MPHSFQQKGGFGFYFATFVHKIVKSVHVLMCDRLWRLWTPGSRSCSPSSLTWKAASKPCATTQAGATRSTARVCVWVSVGVHEDRRQMQGGFGL